MKIGFLFTGYMPLKKCGADPVSAAFLSGGNGLVGNIANNIISYNQQSHMQNKNFDFQRAENQVNRDWQTVEAEKNRSFQQEMLSRQNQLQMDLQAQTQKNNLALQRQQAFYQSPVYQRQQLEQAHLNPQVYFGSQSSFSGSSAPSGGSPSAPSIPHGSMPGSVGGLSPIGFQPTDLNISGLLSGIGNLISSVGSAKKAGVETKILEESMYDYLAKVHEEGKQAQLQTDILKLHQAFQSSTLPDRVKQVEVNLANTIAEGELLKSKNETEKAQKLVNDAIVRMDDAITQLKGEEYTQLKLLWPLTRQKLASEIGLNKARADEADASVASLRSQTAINEVIKKIKDEEFNFTESTLHEQLEGLKRDNMIKSYQVDIAEAAASQARYAESNKEALFWKDFVSDIISSGLQVFNVYKTYMAYKSLNDNTKARLDAKIHEMELQYGDSYEDTYSTFDSQGRKHTFKAKYNRGRMSKADK